MTYQQDRDQAYLNRLQDQITNFVSTYNANPNNNHTTVVLFPGGLASQLVRAHSAWPGPPTSWDVNWLNYSILSGVFYNLNQFTLPDDYQDRFIIPDRVIDWVMLTPYNQFIQWCRGCGLDLFIFGWDWRLPTKQAADFFLNSFMPLFAQRTSAECGSNPLDNFWLLGHSFGGLVVKLIMNQYGNNYVQELAGAITAGTSFYGYGGEVHRYFIGDSDLNGTEGVQGARIVTEIISSLPAGYELMFLDGATFDANQAGFAADPDGYSLTAYPSVDPQTGARADPYNPDIGQGQNQGGLVRYISDYGFQWATLPAGLAAVQAFAESLDASVAGKFYNIRGVQGAQGQELANTCVGQAWSLVPQNLDPQSGHDGIVDVPGPGDGTLPAWSTKLVGNPNRVQTVWGPDLDHMDLMNHKDIQIAVANILQPVAPIMDCLTRSARTRKLRAASRSELNRMVRALGRIPSEPGQWSERRKAEVRRVVLDASLGEPNRIQRLLARLYLDALRMPKQLGRRNRR